MGCAASRHHDPFVLAAEGDAPSLSSWLSSGGDPNSIDGTGGLGSLLHTAARRNQATCIQILLAKGADAGMLCSGHGTPLHAAAAAGAGAAARLLLAGGACPAALWDGHTPAELAAQSGHLRTAALLSKIAGLRQEQPCRPVPDWDAAGCPAAASTAGSSGGSPADGAWSSAAVAAEPGSPRAVVAAHWELCSSIASSEQSYSEDWHRHSWDKEPSPRLPTSCTGPLDWLARRKLIAPPDPLTVGMALLGGPGPPAPSVGLQPGGAQDAQQLEACIEAGCLPLPTDVTYEGFASGHCFDFGSRVASSTGSQLLCPAFSAAVATDPLAEVAPAQQAPPGGEPGDIFLAVGLHSSLPSLPRPTLNLSLLLDVSGSMAAPFRSFYYGGCGRPADVAATPGASASKLEAAKDVAKAMLGNLRPGDSVGISVFSDDAATLRVMAPAGPADVAAMMDAIDALCATGSTNLQAGLDEAIGQHLGEGSCCWEGEPAVTENRVVVLTDAAPNAGDLTERGLLARMKAAAADHVHMTIVGVGLDFNTQLAEAISKVKGASYFSVHSPAELRQRLAEEFDCLMAPLAYNLELRLATSSASHPQSRSGAASAANSSGSSGAASGSEGSGGGDASGGWRISRVHGSPDAERRRLAAGGTIARVHTLFPALQTGAGVKGGVLLLRLEPPPGAPPGAAPPLQLTMCLTDRAGHRTSCVHTIHMPDVGSLAGGQGGVFQSSGARKAVALARYCDTLLGWLTGEWEAISQGSAHTSAAPPAGADALLALSNGASPPQPPGAVSLAPASLAGGSGAPHSRVASSLATGPGASAAAALAAALSAHASVAAGSAVAPGGAACGMDTLWARLMGQEWAASGASAPAGSRAAGPAGGPGQMPHLSALQAHTGLAARPPGPWERRAQPLAVRPQHRARLQRLEAYLAAECEALGPASLQRELALLQRLLAHAG